MAASSPAAREVRDYSRLFFSQATTATPDSQWRLRVSAELIKWAKLSGEAMIVGVRDHIEVWAAERWDEYVAQCDGQYEQLAEAALMSPAAALLRQTQETAVKSSPAEEGRRTPR